MSKSLNVMPEVICADCGWEGDVNDLIQGCCPECGSYDIVEVDVENSIPAMEE
jgi:hypothetical protein